MLAGQSHVVVSTVDCDMFLDAGWNAEQIFS